MIQAAKLFRSGRRMMKATRIKRSGPEIFFLESAEDIGETNNLIDQHPEIAEYLRKRLEEFDAGVKDW